MWSNRLESKMYRQSNLHNLQNNRNELQPQNMSLILTINSSLVMTIILYILVQPSLINMWSRHKERHLYTHRLCIKSQIYGWYWHWHDNSQDVKNVKIHFLLTRNQEQIQSSKKTIQLWMFFFCFCFFLLLYKVQLTMIHHIASHSTGCSKGFL